MDKYFFVVEKMLLFTKDEDFLMLIFRIGDEKIYKKIKGFITKNKLYGVICGYKLEFKKKDFEKKMKIFKI